MAKDPTINQVVIAQQTAEIRDLKAKVDAYEKQLLELAQAVDNLQNDYRHLTNEYIDLREEYNFLQYKGK
jgi:predicted  nucleic acid-binding Zn-ribbon protein